MAIGCMHLIVVGSEAWSVPSLPALCEIAFNLPTQLRGLDQSLSTRCGHSCFDNMNVGCCENRTLD